MILQRSESICNIETQPNACSREEAIQIERENVQLSLELKGYPQLKSALRKRVQTQPLSVRKRGAPQPRMIFRNLLVQYP
jgi:hypothetical protein